MAVQIQATPWSEKETARRAGLEASVIIVNYNAQEKLLNCVASIVQSANAAPEVIVVDNASGDDTIDQIAVDYPQVTLVRSETNLGFGGGCNLGVNQARGEFLVFLNPDTVVQYGWIEALVGALKDDKGVGLATSKILLMERPDRINTCGNDVHLTGLTLCRGMDSPRDTHAQSQEVGAVSGAAFAIRRDLFAELGGFDEDMFLYMEDTELSLRARLAGWGVIYAQGSLVLHDYQLRITPLKVFYQERNRYLMLLKIFRWPTLTVLIPALLLAEVMTWGFVLLADRKNIRNKFRAYLWLLRNWGLVLGKRKAAQALRRVSDRRLLKIMNWKVDLGQVKVPVAAPLARAVLNPVFLLMKGLLLAVVWW